MSDKFVPAIEDVCAAVGAGESIQQAVKEAAAEHALPEHALLNRATRKIGDLDQFRKTANEMRIRAKAEAWNRGDFLNRRIDSETAAYAMRHLAREPDQKD